MLAICLWNSVWPEILFFTRTYHCSGVSLDGAASCFSGHVISTPTFLLLLYSFSNWETDLFHVEILQENLMKNFRTTILWKLTKIEVPNGKDLESSAISRKHISIYLSNCMWKLFDSQLLFLIKDMMLDCVRKEQLYFDIATYKK